MRVRKAPTNCSGFFIPLGRSSLCHSTLWPPAPHSPVLFLSSVSRGFHWYIRTITSTNYTRKQLLITHTTLFLFSALPHLSSLSLHLLSHFHTVRSIRVSQQAEAQTRSFFSPHPLYTSSPYSILYIHSMCCMPTRHLTLLPTSHHGTPRYFIGIFDMRTRSYRLSLLSFSCLRFSYIYELVHEIMMSADNAFGLR